MLLIDKHIFTLRIFNNTGNSIIRNSDPCKKTGASKIIAKRSRRGHWTGPESKTLRPE